MNVVVVAPHPDDEALGCGGAILGHVRDGDRVVVAFLTSGEGGLEHYPVEKARAIREREAAKAAQILGVAAHVFLRLPDGHFGEDQEAAAGALGEVLAAERPDLVYAPHENEDHADHAAALDITRRALTGAASAEVLTYEIWTPLARFERVVDISDEMATKLRAVRTYRSQVQWWRYDLAIKGLNAYRGAMVAGTTYAEVFAAL
jgi:LmbE family N-acetylglucosaminyl deacetylase